MHLIGFQVYWILRSWMHWKVFRVKFKVITEQILMMAGSARKKLHDQERVNQFMKDVVQRMIKEPKQKRSDFLKENMNNSKKKISGLPDVSEVLSSVPQFPT